MIDWQPMETAPKDGTHILLWCTGSTLYEKTPPFASVGYWYSRSTDGHCWVESCQHMYLMTPVRWARIDPPKD